MLLALVSTMLYTYAGAQITQNDTIAKPKFTDEQIRRINDSILKEGLLLYRLERAAWIGSDMCVKNLPESVMSTAKGYTAYQSGDSEIFVLHNDDNKRIYRSVFRDGEYIDGSEDMRMRRLTKKERRLVRARNDIFNNLMSEQEEGQIMIDNRASPNMIVIPQGKGFRFYMICGAKEPNIIPLGQDYYAEADSKSRIIRWNQMHKAFLGVPITGKVTALIHSHQPQEPFITPTDICTFKLYGPMMGIKTMVVYSPLEKYFLYDAEKDTIETGEGKDLKNRLDQQRK